MDGHIRGRSRWFVDNGGLAVKIIHFPVITTHPLCKQGMAQDVNLLGEGP
jgi:hypothetical protein